MASLRVRHDTVEIGGHDIHVRTLRDLQQFDDPDGEAEALGISSAMWPMFGVVWTASRVLAEIVSSEPLEGRRVLEVGCGIGLTSLLLHLRGADVTATDRHPRAGEFLAENVALNGGGEIPFVRADWRDERCELGRFDLIVGSDLLYERDHAEVLSEFIVRHSAERCDVIIVDPGRGNHGRFGRLMKERGFEYTRTRHEDETSYDEPFGGNILRFRR